MYADHANGIEMCLEDMLNDVIMTSLVATQVASLSIDLRSRQQQVDTMRGELQAAGKRSTRDKQQSESQAEMLMEQLAIAQAAGADQKVHLPLHLHTCFAAVDAFTERRSCWQTLRCMHSHALAL